MSIIKTNKLFKLLTAGMAVLLLVSQIGTTFADFDQNNLIADSLFTATNSMTQSDIQSFLTSQGGFLANWTDSVDMYNTFTYHTDPTDPNSSTATTVPCQVHHHTNLRAAQIIYQAASGWNPVDYTDNYPVQQWWNGTYDGNGNKITIKEYTGCGTLEPADPYFASNPTTTVSPKVILATLQKEQILVTQTGTYSQNSSDYTNSTYPSNEYALSWAVGYNVPDKSIPTSGRYRGFYEQVFYGALQLRYNYQCAENDSSWSGFEGATPSCSPYKVNQTISIDGTPVTLSNASTASLYRYTPHFSGNQHFVTIYGQWFGTGTTNISWNFENLDGSSGSSISGYTKSVGLYPTMVNLNGVLHAFYYDASTGQLRHAYADNSGWHFENLDGGGGANGRITANVGETPTAIIQNGVINVFYYDITNGALRHAWSDTNGTNWTFETLDGAGGATGHTNDHVGLWSSVTVFNSTLQLFYYDDQSGLLRHAWNNGTWHFENLDGDQGSVGHWVARVGDTSTATVYNGTLQLFYYDSTYGNLRHAWADGAGWHFENLDGTLYGVSKTDSNTGRNPTLAVYNNSLQLFYYDIGNGNLRHIWTSPGQPWKFENLDGDPGSIGHEDGNLGITPSATVFQNILYVFYYDQNNHDLKHAYSDTAGWHFGNVDGSTFSASFRDSNAGMYPVAIPYGTNGTTLELLYYDSSTGSLRHAFGALAP